MTSNFAISIRSTQSAHSYLVTLKFTDTPDVCELMSEGIFMNGAAKNSRDPLYCRALAQHKSKHRTQNCTNMYIKSNEKMNT